MATVGTRRITSRATLRVLSLILASIALALSLGTPSFAGGLQATASSSDSCPLTKAMGRDSTGGAFAEACTYTASNGGFGVEVHVRDDKADGKCAHAALRWLHDNGNYYYDYGMYVCGYGAEAWYWPDPRNQTYYQRVDLEVFVDGGPVTVLLIQTF